MSEIDNKKNRNVSMMQLKSQSGVRSQSFGMRSMSRLKLRRPSFGFSGVPGIRPVERTSQIAIEFKRPVLTYLPTYQLGSTYKFHLPTVQKITDQVLDEHWTGHKYNVQDSPALALRIAGELMRRLKAIQFNRYRIICVVTIGQRRAQSYNNAVAFLWDHEQDNYVDVNREVTTAFIQVTTFGVYLD
ncbi:dynein light chain Tctex-type protein 2B-like [Maniola hyperantus]|uniref:dynein light chain Tctex-type protein 2B-like n=1 Tax=Aphantopus hyperantus TaxID=2795564 RepID=UPI00156876F8|nr:tctex1 domain-containing protein 1-like [Maniola hyperantus]